MMASVTRSKSDNHPQITQMAQIKSKKAESRKQKAESRKQWCFAFCFNLCNLRNLWIVLDRSK